MTNELAKTREEPAFTIQFVNGKASPMNIVRRCVFRPYTRGNGPTFTLTTWESVKRSEQPGRYYMGYRLAMIKGSVRTVLFEGDDYSPSPGSALDSDEATAGLMSFLTLRPGDTDDEYFHDYTAAQLSYCEQYAEGLSCEAICKLGEY